MGHDEIVTESDDPEMWSKQKLSPVGNTMSCSEGPAPFKLSLTSSGSQKGQYGFLLNWLRVFT